MGGALASIAGAANGRHGPGMRFSSPIVAAALLCACATLPATPAAPVPQAPATTPAPSRVALLLGAAGRADAPTQQAVESLLGRPDLARQDGAGAALTYRFEQCALLLLFTADARDAMRLAEAHAGSRRSGAPAPSLEQCAAEADARGS